MNKKGPIIIIEDDIDDEYLIGEVLRKINPGNEVLFFRDGNLALHYLKNSRKQPFLILSDINMPVLDGFRLRDMVFDNPELRVKCVPYLFFTTSSAEKTVVDAYSKSVQGFFIKPNNLKQLTKTLSVIVEYWSLSKSPTYFCGD
ncbi:MAG TPA: response regulator [Flavobacterium sp.]|jgi:CheY-like chemotaxis protein